MIRVAIALLALPLVAVAAPVPQPESDAARFKKLFGKEVLPKKLGKFELKGDTLTVTFPKEHVGADDLPLLCPHTARQVEGDFELTAGVRITAPKEPPAGGKQWDMGAGLAAWDDEAEKFADGPWTIFAARRFDVHHLPEREKYPWWEETPAYFQQHGHVPEATEGADPTVVRHLRLRRSGDKFTVSVSEDGKEWTEQATRQVDVGKTLKVGVWAYKRVDGPGDVVFENVTLTTGK